MDFRLETFLADPDVRFDAEAEAYVRDVARRLVARVLDVVGDLDDAVRILPRHVLLALFVLTPDPLTRLNRSGLAVQQLRVKSMLKIFRRVHDGTRANLELDPVRGRIDAQLLANVRRAVDEASTFKKWTGPAIVHLAAHAAEVCGMLINATHAAAPARTITQASLEAYGGTYTASVGHACSNDSLQRLLRSLRGIALPDAPPAAASSRHCAAAPRARGVRFCDSE